MTRPLRFGFELEMGDYRTRAPVAADILRREGLTLSPRQCGAHCQCQYCRYSRTDGLMAFQSDAGVAVEFVSRILTTNSTKDRKEMRLLQKVYPELLSALSWRPDGSFGAGNHCHVGWPSRPNHIQQARVHTVLNALFASETSRWQRIADGGCGRHRGYNGTATYDSHGAYDSGHFTGNWISDHGHQTVEFRLWNTPVDPKRLLVHPAISTALMAWALAVVDEHSHLDTFDTARGTWGWVEDRVVAERKRVINLIREIWRDKPSANLAAELLAA